MNGGSSLRVIAVASGKGGVGKTNVAVNIAAALAGTGQRVMLMDADLGLANVDIMLGICPQHDLHDVITGARRLEEVIVEGPEGMKIVPAASGVGRMAGLSVQEHAGLIRAFDDIAALVDVLIIDNAAGIADSVISFSKAAQEIVVVVCDEPASMTDAYALIKVLNREHHVKRFQILANMVRDAAHGRRLYAKLASVADEFLQVSLGYLGSVPLDPKLQLAVRQQAPVMQLYPGSAASVAFSHIASRIGSLPPPAFSSGQLAFFAGKQVQCAEAARGVS